jgi:hypothetical protein
LRALLNELRQTRADLMSRDHHRLQAALQRQQSLPEARRQLDEERAAFRRHAATALRLDPGTLTLQRLAELLAEPQRAQLAAACVRLQKLVVEANRLNQNNAALLYYCLEFLNRFFADLTGGGSASYTQAGRQSSAAAGKLLEARG